MENRSKSGDSTEPKKQFDLELVKEIHEAELLVKERERKTATFEHVMSMMLMINEKIEAITSGIQLGLTMVVGPPGTRKTDTVVQILNVLYHNCLIQRMLIITHSNKAQNDLFEKIMQRDWPAHCLLRLGQGEQELATELYFSWQGWVNAVLVRR